MMDFLIQEPLRFGPDDAFADERVGLFHPRCGRMHEVGKEWVLANYNARIGCPHCGQTGRVPSFEDVAA